MRLVAAHVRLVAAHVRWVAAHVRQVAAHVRLVAANMLQSFFFPCTYIGNCALKSPVFTGNL